ncbi:unnamed protein product [Brassica oleracea var. botrytis]|uniref:(rape) hypothetical protein n=1 Tax=Brassica napus TaxID=3708 RepID=A0A816LMP0_BRANA|nr:unnamed protein product [Brassica napus]
MSCRGDVRQEMRPSLLKRSSRMEVKKQVSTEIVSKKTKERGQRNSSHQVFLSRSLDLDKEKTVRVSSRGRQTEPLLRLEAW